MKKFTENKDIGSIYIVEDEVFRILYRRFSIYFRTIKPGTMPGLKEVYSCV